MNTSDDIIIFVGIIMEVVVVERIGFISRTLFEIESVVLDISLHSGLVHEAIVFLRTVA